MISPQTSPRRALGQMLLGNQVQQAIYVATKLGIPDLLMEGPKRSDELAQATGAHPEALYRLLRALASYGFFAEREPCRFELTPLAALLQTRVPGSMRAYALWSGGVSYQAFGALEYSVMTGKPAFEYLFGTEFFAFLNEYPEIGAIFDDLMTVHTAPVASVVAAYDFSDVYTVVDVGGGRGEMLAAILSAHPSLQGVLVDHPRVFESAQRTLARAGVADRCEIVSGDILAWLPEGGDAYIVKSVVHGLDDEAASGLLNHCRHAMDPGGKLLLIEFIMPPGNDPFPGKMMDLLMLVGCYGRERTETEFRALLERAGFELTNITTTKYAYSIIEGRPE